MFVDFLIGLFAANALPHYVFGRLDSRVLSLFGFSAAGSVAYAFFCTVVSLVLFHDKYGLDALLDHGVLLGVLFVVLSYYVGWPIISKFLIQRPSD